MRTAPKSENNYLKLKRDAEILKLREEGLTYRQISQKIAEQFPDMGVGKDTVASVVQKAAKEARAELSKNATLIVLKELKDLDMMEQKYLVNITKTNIPVNKDVDMVLKIKERRSKYLGLDAPTKSNIHQESDQTIQVIDFSNIDIKKETNPDEKKIEKVNEVLHE
jgi:hypothetical protein